MRKIYIYNLFLAILLCFSTGEQGHANYTRQQMIDVLTKSCDKNCRSQECMKLIGFINHNGNKEPYHAYLAEIGPIYNGLIEKCKKEDTVPQSVKDFALHCLHACSGNCVPCYGQCASYANVFGLAQEFSVLTNFSENQVKQVKEKYQKCAHQVTPCVDACANVHDNSSISDMTHCLEACKGIDMSSLNQQGHQGGAAASHFLAAYAGYGISSERPKQCETWCQGSNCADCVGHCAGYSSVAKGYASCQIAQKCEGLCANTSTCTQCQKQCKGVQAVENHYKQCTQIASCNALCNSTNNCSDCLSQCVGKSDLSGQAQQVIQTCQKKNTATTDQCKTYCNDASQCSACLEHCGGIESVKTQYTACQNEQECQKVCGSQSTCDQCVSQCQNVTTKAIQTDYQNCQKQSDAQKCLQQLHSLPQPQGQSMVDVEEYIQKTEQEMQSTETCKSLSMTLQDFVESSMVQKSDSALVKVYQQYQELVKCNAALAGYSSQSGLQTAISAFNDANQCSGFGLNQFSLDGNTLKYQNQSSVSPPSGTKLTNIYGFIKTLMQQGTQCMTNYGGPCLQEINHINANNQCFGCQPSSNDPTGSCGCVNPYLWNLWDHNGRCSGACGSKSACQNYRSNSACQPFLKTEAWKLLPPDIYQLCYVGWTYASKSMNTFEQKCGGSIPASYFGNQIDACNKACAGVSSLSSAFNCIVGGGTLSTMQCRQIWGISANEFNPHKPGAISYKAPSNAGNIQTAVDFLNNTNSCNQGCASKTSTSDCQQCIGASSCSAAKITTATTASDVPAGYSNIVSCLDTLKSVVSQQTQCYSDMTKGVTMQTSSFANMLQGYNTMQSQFKSSNSCSGLNTTFTDFITKTASTLGDGKTTPIEVATALITVDANLKGQSVGDGIGTFYEYFAPLSSPYGYSPKTQYLLKNEPHRSSNWADGGTPFSFNFVTFEYATGVESAIQASGLSNLQSFLASYATQAKQCYSLGQTCENAWGSDKAPISSSCGWGSKSLQERRQACSCVDTSASGFSTVTNACQNTSACKQYFSSCADILNTDAFDLLSMDMYIGCGLGAGLANQNCSFTLSEEKQCYSDMTKGVSMQTNSFANMLQGYNTMQSQFKSSNSCSGLNTTFADFIQTASGKTLGDGDKTPIEVATALITVDNNLKGQSVGEGIPTFYEYFAPMSSPYGYSPKTQYLLKNEPHGSSSWADGGTPFSFTFKGHMFQYGGGVESALKQSGLSNLQSFLAAYASQAQQCYKLDSSCESAWGGDKAPISSSCEWNSIQERRQACSCVNESSPTFSSIVKACKNTSACKQYFSSCADILNTDAFDLLSMDIYITCGLGAGLANQNCSSFGKQASLAEQQCNTACSGKDTPSGCMSCLTSDACASVPSLTVNTQDPSTISYVPPASLKNVQQCVTMLNSYTDCDQASSGSSSSSDCYKSLSGSGCSKVSLNLSSQNMTSSSSVPSLYSHFQKCLGTLNTLNSNVQSCISNCSSATTASQCSSCIDASSCQNASITPALFTSSSAYEYNWLESSITSKIGQSGACADQFSELLKCNNLCSADSYEGCQSCFQQGYCKNAGISYTDASPYVSGLPSDTSLFGNITNCGQILNQHYIQQCNQDLGSGCSALTGSNCSNVNFEKQSIQSQLQNGEGCFDTMKNFDACQSSLNKAANASNAISSCYEVLAGSSEAEIPCGQLGINFGSITSNGLNTAELPSWLNQLRPDGLLDGCYDALINLRKCESDAENALNQGGNACTKLFIQGSCAGIWNNCQNSSNYTDKLCCGLEPQSVPWWMDNVEGGNIAACFNDISYCPPSN